VGGIGRKGSECPGGSYGCHFEELIEMIIPVENRDTLKAVRGFLKALLECGAVELIMTPMRTPAGTVVPALVSSPDMLAVADPLAPVLSVNGATLAGKLSVKEPRPKVGVVLRSCELRALVELTKMQQASLDDLVLIAIDCAGTSSVPLHQRLAAASNGSSEEHPLWQEFFEAVAENPQSPKTELRPACKVCEQPVFNGLRPQDIAIHLLGYDAGQELHVVLPAKLASRIASKMGLAQPISEEPPEGRQKAIDKLVSARIVTRDAEFALIRARLEGPQGIAGVFASCIRCHNCMTVCPSCYCKTCVFKSAIFDHEPMQFVNWARQKGAYRLPSDTVLFHMTRLNHMSLSCVGCGMCTEACPSELPVGMVFRAIGQRVQATFEYAPGRSLEDPLPLVTFKADEWTDVGE
jgi:formate dehydrogenase subunit beta